MFGRLGSWFFSQDNTERYDAQDGSKFEPEVLQRQPGRTKRVRGNRFGFPEEFGYYAQQFWHLEATPLRVVWAGIGSLGVGLLAASSVPLLTELVGPILPAVILLVLFVFCLLSIYLADGLANVPATYRFVCFLAGLLLVIAV